MLNLPSTTCMGLMYENSPGPFLFTAATLNSSALPNKTKQLQNDSNPSVWEKVAENEIFLEVVKKVKR